MVKRRSMLIGLGALATGSGAVFSSAAFASSTTASANFRVVVEESLTVEPGTLFREGGDPNSDFAPYDANYKPNSETLGFSGNLFDGDGLDEVTVEDLPAAAINEETNDDIELSVATAFETDGDVGSGSYGVLQVRNDTADSKDIAIRFSDFGTDVGDSDELVAEEDVIRIFQFRDSTETHISTSDVGTDTHTVANTVTVESGAVEQIYIDYNTNVASNDIRNAVDSTSSPFNESGEADTVNLVDEISIGVEADNNDVQ